MLFVISTWSTKKNISAPSTSNPVFQCKKKREAGFAPRFFIEDLYADEPIFASSFCVLSTLPIHGFVMSICAVFMRDSDVNNRRVTTSVGVSRQPRTLSLTAYFYSKSLEFNVET